MVLSINHHHLFLSLPSFLQSLIFSLDFNFAIYMVLFVVLVGKLIQGIFKIKN